MGGKRPEKRVEVKVSWHVSEKATVGWLGRFLLGSSVVKAKRKPWSSYFACKESSLMSPIILQCISHRSYFFIV